MRMSHFVGHGPEKFVFEALRKGLLRELTYIGRQEEFGQKVRST